MSKSAYVVFLAACALALAAPSFAADSGQPSAKAAAQVKDFQIWDLESVSSGPAVDPSVPDADSLTTGWETILSTKIKTANQKDLIIEPSFECMLITQTAVKGKNSLDGVADTWDTSSAESSVIVRVGIDTDNDGDIDDFAYPQSGTGLSLAGEAVTGDGVTFCERDQKLEALFGGIIECVDGTDDGTDVTLDECTVTEEELKLLLNSVNAASFNFIFPDVSSGTKGIYVQAKISLATSAQQGTANAQAGIGRGTVVVESVRFVKDQDGLIELE